MKKLNISHSGISNIVFAGTMAALVVVAATGYGLYGISLSHNNASDTMTATTESTTSQMTNQTYAYAFTPKTGAMVNNAWILVVPVGMHEYAVSVHAEGLESNTSYVLEGALSSGNMQTVPISSQSMTMNTTSGSEFRSDANGSATYWIILENDPAVTFENLQLYLLPGGMMDNATLVATATFAMMSESASTMISHT